MSWPLLGDRLDAIHEGRRLWNRPMFMEVFFIGAWSLWKERNNKHFRGVMPSLDSWLQIFKSDFDLLRHRNKEGLGPFITEFFTFSLSFLKLSDYTLEFSLLSPPQPPFPPIM